MNGYFPSLYGNEASRARLARAAVSGTLPHALLFEGKEGSGKKHFATLIASALCCENSHGQRIPCEACPACRKIINRLSVDVTYLDREDRATIGVDQIRDLRSDMHLSSTELKNKIYIIDNAECLTPQAQNALLISIEEPPPHVYIFLLATRTDLILPTIKSRVQAIKMQSFLPEEIESYLLNHSSDALNLKATNEQAFRALLVSSEGTIGHALSLLPSKETEALLQEREITDEILSALTAKVSFARLFEKIALLPTKRQELASALSALSKGVRDLILLKRDENTALLYLTDREKATEEAEGLSIRYLLALHDTISEAENHCALNTNVSTILSSLTNDLYACRAA